MITKHCVHPGKREIWKEGENRSNMVENNPSDKTEYLKMYQQFNITIPFLDVLDP